MSSIAATETHYKQPYDKRQYSMDFDALMVTDETIVTRTITSAKIDGAATNLTISDDAISGHTVTFWIAGGTHRVHYRITVRVTTSAGQQLEGDGILVVSDK